MDWECAIGFNLWNYIPGRWSLKIECGPWKVHKKWLQVLYEPWIILSRRAASLFSSFCSNGAKQVALFCCPFYCSFSYSVTKRVQNSNSYKPIIEYEEKSRSWGNTIRAATETLTTLMYYPKSLIKSSYFVVRPGTHCMQQKLSNSLSQSFRIRLQINVLRVPKDSIVGTLQNLTSFITGSFGPLGPGLWFLLPSVASTGFRLRP